MPYAFFHTYFPEIAKRECAPVIIPDPDAPLPPGEYALFEMYCDEAECDCRRVFFYVLFRPPERAAGRGRVRLGGPGFLCPLDGR